MYTRTSVEVVVVVVEEEEEEVCVVGFLWAVFCFVVFFIFCVK